MFWYHDSEARRIFSLYPGSAPISAASNATSHYRTTPSVRNENKFTARSWRSPRSMCSIRVCETPSQHRVCPWDLCNSLPPCRALGGCPVNLHQREGAVSMPPISQSAYASPWSQPPPTTFPVATPTFSPLHITTSLPPIPLSIPTARSPINQPVAVPDPQPPVSPSVGHPSKSLISTIASPLPTRIVAEPPSSMNPLPNSRFASQMWLIFTHQSMREQEIQENARVMEEQRLATITKVKNIVTICAWLAVRLPNQCKITHIHYV